MAYRNVSLGHQRLGNIVGIGHGKVEKFLGLKYADIPGRFEDSILYEGTNYDATCYSPSVIQPKNSLEHEYEIIQHSLPIPAVCNLQDEFKSLTLNITRPAKLQPHLLPVFVWIHGKSTTYVNTKSANRRPFWSY
ncbi:hypothetical protein EDC01DRAFT_521630 [Geopyxis carbonaria]|nr:hypothetical protein EDC01DRAFT_521630 [Geopyxis carbonaria]